MPLSQALEAQGYNPDTTPVDTLMDAPLPVHLAVAEAMEGDAGTAFVAAYDCHIEAPAGYQAGTFQGWAGENAMADAFGLHYA